MKNYTKKIEKNQEKFKNGFLDKPTEKKKLIPRFGEMIFSKVSESMRTRIEECANFIAFLKGDEEAIRLHGGNFCNNRFCPFCSWRKAKKDGYIILFLLNYIREMEKKEFIFLTLTAPNVVKEQLNDEILDFNKSFERMIKTKKFKAMSHGYIRKLEVTYQGDEFVNEFNKNKYPNKKIGDRLESFDTYHPHFHIVIAVNKSYFKSRDYIKRAEWLEMWREAKRDNSITQVDIRKAEMSDMKGVYELATYSAKASDYLHSQEIFDTFHSALKGKQLITFNGIFKDTLKKYKAGELEDYEVLDTTIYRKLQWFGYGNARGYELLRELEIDVTGLEKLKKDEIEID